MDRNGFLAVIFLFLIFSDVSDATRRLEEAPKVDNSTAQQQVSPLPNSGPSDVKSDPKPEDGVKSDENDEKKVEEHKVSDNSTVVDSQVPRNSSAVDSQISTNSSVVDSQMPKNSSVVDSQVATNSSVVDSGEPNNSSVVGSQVSTSSSVVDPKGLNDTSSVSSSPAAQNDTSSVTQPSTVKETDDEKSGQEANRGDNKPPTEQKIPETCDALPTRCTDGGSLVACLQNVENVPGELAILVQNRGKKTLKVSMDVPNSVESYSKELEIPKDQSEKVNISIDASKSKNIILNAGSGECKLLVGPVVSEPNFIVRLPSFDKIGTPVNGAYLLIVAGIVVGLTWGCCKCRKTKRHEGIPYQELEMGVAESVSATSVETAEGWDQGWDDDWDDDPAVKSPAVGSISANGLTARSTNKDGWDNGWDD